MNTEVPVFNTLYKEDSDVDELSYGFLTTTSEIDLALSHLDSMVPFMMQLAEIENLPVNCQ